MLTDLFANFRTAAVVAVLGVLAGCAAQTSGAPKNPQIHGQADAARVIDLHLNPGCPGCANVMGEAIGRRHADAVSAGRVAFHIRAVYFDKAELWADMLATCAGQNYVAAFATTMTAQEKWSATYHREEKTGITLDEQTQSEALKRLVTDAGLLTRAQADTCLTDAQLAQRLVDAWNARKAAANIVQVPLMITGGTRVLGGDIVPWMRANL